MGQPITWAVLCQTTTLTTTLTTILSSLCRWFNTETFKRYIGISKFHVTHWMDKTWQEAGSWVLVASTTQRGPYFFFFFFFFIWLPIFSMGWQVQKKKKKKVGIWVFSSGEVGNKHLVMCLLRRLFTLWPNCSHCSYVKCNTLLPPHGRPFLSIFHRGCMNVKQDIHLPEYSFAKLLPLFFGYPWQLQICIDHKLCNPAREMCEAVLVEDEQDVSHWLH